MESWSLILIVAKIQRNMAPTNIDRIPYFFVGKSFDITYIRVVFYSPRPESFAIYKRSTQNGPWTPYQYYRYDFTLFQITFSNSIYYLDQQEFYCIFHFNNHSNSFSVPRVVTLTVVQISCRLRKAKMSLEHYVPASTVIFHRYAMVT